MSNIVITGEVAHLCSDGVLSATFTAKHSTTVVPDGVKLNMHTTVTYTYQETIITHCPDCKSFITKDRAVFLHPGDLQIL